MHNLSGNNSSQSFLGTDRGPKTDVLTPIQGSSSVSNDYKNKAGQFVCTGRAGKVLRWDNRRGRDEDPWIGVFGPLSAPKNNWLDLFPERLCIIMNLYVGLSSHALVWAPLCRPNLPLEHLSGASLSVHQPSSQHSSVASWLAITFLSTCLGPCQQH